MIRWIIFLVLIVCQDMDLFLIALLVVTFSREHRMQQYLKSRVYQMDMVF